MTSKPSPEEGSTTGDRGAALRAAIVLALLALTPPAASAQAPRWQVDLNGSRIEYDSLAALNAPSVSALTEWRGSSFFARLYGSATAFEGAGWSGQGRGEASAWMAPLGRLKPFRVEVAGSVGGSRHSAGFDSFLGRADARVHLARPRYGAWAGASVAVARNSFDSASVRGVIPNVGLWAQSSTTRATLSVAGTRVSGDVYPEATLSLAGTRGLVDLTAYVGHRGAPSEVLGSAESWGGATAAVWVRDRAAVVAAAGAYSSDVLQGLPGGRFFSIGIRLSGRRSRPIPVEVSAPIVYSREAAREGSISFAVDGAARVEVAGDWTSWQRVALERDADGRWVLPDSLEPGVYRFNLRVDGERWMVPAGVPEVDDGYGGTVGLLIVSN